MILPKVIVIVLNWNGGNNTIECLKSVECLEYPDYKIIVVDNASSDGSQKIMRGTFPGITLLENTKNLGFGGGFNRGIVEATKRGADYVLCLNNDVILDKNFLTELVMVGELDTGIAGLSPLEYCYDDPDRINFAGGVVGFPRVRIFGHGELDRGQFNRVKETRLLCGPAIMLKLKALMDVGLFDTDYFYGPEDLDIAIRCLKRGYRLVFVPSAKLWHRRRGVTGGKITPLNVFFDVRNYFLFMKKRANKLEFILSTLYFGLIIFPLTVMRGIIIERIEYVTSALRGLMWHLDNKLVPSDPVIADAMRANKTISRTRKLWVYPTDTCENDLKSHR